MNQITYVLAVYNEETLIGPCLDRIKDYAKEILIFDDGSTDNTLEICKDFNTTIISIPKALRWNEGCDAVKNFMIEKVQTGICHVVDVDEMVEYKKHYSASYINAISQQPTIYTPSRDELARLGTKDINKIIPMLNEIKDTLKKEYQRKIFRIHPYKSSSEFLKHYRYSGYVHQEFIDVASDKILHSEPNPDIIHWHLKYYKDSNQVDERQNLWIKMLHRSYHEPSLRRHTNNWWYDVLYPRDKEHIEKIVKQEGYPTY